MYLWVKESLQFQSTEIWTPFSKFKTYIWHNEKRDRGIFFFFIRLVLSLYCIIYFYNKCILLQFPVSAITWGHNDKRLFVATGNEIHIGWVSPTIGSLQLLSRLKIHNSLRNEDQVQLLPLPCRLQNLIGMLFTQTIRVCIVYEF